MKLSPPSKEKAIQKIRHYCAYQERSHLEVKEKLYSYSLYKKDVEEIISLLIEENYLNEQRFAEQFAGSKFRIKNWGKIKIEYALKQKQVSPYNIRLGLKQIDAEAYLECLKKLARQKWEQLDGENSLNRQSKTSHYLLQKGFEPDLVYSVIKEIKTVKEDPSLDMD